MSVPVLGKLRFRGRGRRDRGSDTARCNVCFRRNPSGGSGLSETGSLDRAKAALERRKKAEDGAGNPILCRVEVTRPNPDSLIDELIKATNLEQTDLESSESTFPSIIAIFLARLRTHRLTSFRDTFLSWIS